MDSSTLKMLLESQERAYKSALDTVVKQMNDQINKLETKVSDLTTSLEFTQREVDDLKFKEREHDKERKEDKTTIEKLGLKVKELEDKTIYQEDYSRRKNLRISGLVERPNETWEQTSDAVTSLLENKLQLQGVVLERAHRVGPRQDDKPRTVVARFNRYSDRDATIRRGRYLKGTNIFLNEDMSSESLAIKNAQMPRFKQARADGKIAFFRHTKLIIREKTEYNSTAQRQAAMSEESATGIAVASNRSGPGPAAGSMAGVRSGASVGDDLHSSPSLARASASHLSSPAAAVSVRDNLRSSSRN